MPKSVTVTIQLVITHTLNVESVPSGVSFAIDGGGASTPSQLILYDGNYTIVMPLEAKIGGVPYYFKQWDNGSTNPSRAINLTMDVTIRATYTQEKIDPIPWVILPTIAGAFTTIAGERE